MRQSRSEWQRRAAHLLLLVALSGSAVAQKIFPQPPDHDDPKARQEYLEDLRGASTGLVPPGARLKALQQMEQMLQAEGQQFWLQQGNRREGEIPGFAPTSSQWLFIGPQPTNNLNPASRSSGRTTSVAVDPSDTTGNTVYIGAAQGGVWKTINGGTTWTPLTDFQPSLAIGSLAIDGSTNPSTIYAGTGEQSFAFDSYYGAGVLKSTDGGTTWTQKGAAVFAGPLTGCTSPGVECGGAFIGSLSVQPGGSGDPNTAVLLAAVGLPVGFGSGPGVYRSTDGGTTWSLVLGANLNVGASVVQFATTQIAYAGMQNLGIYRSTNGGVDWTPVNGIGPSNVLAPAGRVALSVALSDTLGKTLYVGVGTANFGATLSGFYKTTNGGDTWTKLGPNTGFGLPDYCASQCWYDHVVIVSPTDPNVVFVGGSGFPNTNFLHRSSNGGASWNLATTNIHADQQAAAFTHNGARLYVGNDGGVYSTTDMATLPVTWANLNDSLGITQFYSYFALHPTEINITLAGAQDNGTQRYDGFQSRASAWGLVTCGDGAGSVIDYSDPTIVYANCQNIDIRKSTTGGVDGFVAMEQGINSDPVTFIPPMVGDNNPGALNYIYFGTNRVYRTRNGAASWQAISAALAGGTISSIALAPSDRTIMYVGNRGGRIWRGQRLTNTGPTDCATALDCFTEVTGSGLVPGSRINAIAVSPADSDTIFVGQSGFSFDTNQHIARSTTGGSTWLNITSNLPNTPVNDIVVDPDIPNTLYVATDVGVFRSQDNGASWSTLANSLPRVAVYGLELHRPTRTLRAATHGRGFWDLDVPIAGPGGVLTPGQLTFSARAISSTSSAQNLVFSNNGTTNTTISATNITGDFALTANTCAGVLSPDATCNMSVTFTPLTAGPGKGTLDVLSNAIVGPARALLSGMGVPQNDDIANALNVDSATYTHTTNTLGATTASDPVPSCLSGSPVSKSVWYVYRPGSSGLATINSRTSDYDTVLAVYSGSPGALTEVGCNDDIGNVPESPSEVVLNVTAGTRYYVQVFGFVPKDGGVLHFSVTGPAPLPAGFARSPSSINFADTALNQNSATSNVTVTNNTGASLTLVTSISSEFNIATNTCPSTLADLASCVVGVRFQPTTLGLRNGNLSLTPTPGSTLQVSLSGIGVSVVANPATLTFGSAVVGRTLQSSISVQNNTSASITLAFAPTSQIAVPSGCLGSLVAGASCTAIVTFTPSAAGARTGTIGITSSPSFPVAPVQISGTGVDFALVLSRPRRPSRDGSIAFGASQTFSFSISPHGDLGAVPLSVTCQVPDLQITCSARADSSVLGSSAVQASVVVANNARRRASRLGTRIGNASVVMKVRVAAGGLTRILDIPVTIEK